MAKNSITDYSKTASLNTDIQSVDIDEGCLPSGINNAIRELMADLAAMNDGTVSLTSPSFAAATITGDLTVDTSTLKVDSTNNRVGIGTSSPREKLDVIGDVIIESAYDGTQFIRNVDVASVGLAGHYIGIGAKYNGNPVTPVVLAGATDSDGTAGSFSIRLDDSEKMRIDSSGNVGIGTTTPSSALEVAGQVISTNSFKLTANVSTPSGNSMFRPASNTLAFATNSTERLRIDSSGQVGIGTTSPLGILHVSKSSGDVVTRYTSGDGDDVAFFMGGQSSGANGRFLYDGSNNMRFYTNSSERMRIDSSGNVLVGQTSADSTVVGIGLLSYGSLYSTRDGDFALTVNRKTSDGEIARFQKNGTNIGSIGVDNNDNLYIQGTSIAGGLQFGDGGGGGNVLPHKNGADVDNTIDLGSTSRRFDDIYATNGTIQTSDRNEKQDIEALSEAEQRVAVAAKGLLRKFRWIDSVEEKGDDARIHFGIIAQDLQAAFEAEGLDAGRYAMFINSTWTDEETGEERSRMGVRYNQLLAFIIAAI